MSDDTTACADHPPTSREDLEPAIGLLSALEDGRESAKGEIGESETTLVVSCSMSRCDHGGPLWPIEPSRSVVGVQTLGNQTWEQYDGETVLDGDIAHLSTEYDVTAVVVVGHTTCEVVADAYEQYVGAGSDPSAGIAVRLTPLVSLVEDAFEEGYLDEAASLRTMRYRLVEYNVVRQVAFLQRTLRESVTTVGYVFDQAGAYSSFPEKHYLVALNGETEPAAIRTRLPGDTSASVASLL